MAAQLQANAAFVLRVDADGIIDTADGSALFALGLRPEELIGRSLLSISQLQGLPSLLPLVERAQNGVIETTTVSVASRRFEIHVEPRWFSRLPRAGVLLLGFDASSRRAEDDAARCDEEHDAELTARNEVEQRLADSAALLQAIFEATADGILALDREGNVVAFNRHFLGMWGIPSDVADTRSASIFEFIEAMLRQPKEFVRGIRVLRAEPDLDGPDMLNLDDGRVFEASSSPKRAGAELLGRVWCFRDVTERERNAQLLRTAEHALRARDELLAVAAHEIRGPLTAVHLAAQSLAEGTVTNEASLKLLRIIEREDRRLARFVDELLDVSRLRAGRLELELEEVDLAALVRDVVIRLDRDGQFVVDTEVAIVGLWDRSRVDQIITNLLTNAVKFGRGRPVEISVRSDSGHAELRVRDYGIGIDPDKQEEIWRPFERAVPQRHYGGLGLGLYIVRAIVESMGGSVSVDSRPSAGSTFVVRLPVRRDHDE